MTPYLPMDAVAPAPLAPLTHTVISPANIAAAERERAAVRLTPKQRKRYRQRINQLKQFLRGIEKQHTARCALLDEVDRRLDDLQPVYRATRAAYQSAPADLTLRRILVDMVAYADRLKTRRQQLRHEIEQYNRAASECSALEQRLDGHRLSVERDKLAAKMRKDLREEARIYETLLVDRWTRLGYCHRYSGPKNKEIVEKVQFERCVSTLDGHYFKIDASYKTAFGGWKTNVPQGVRIVEHLLSPSTLDELSLACQRQVTAVHSEQSGAWVIVNRLNSVDGLMNYVTFEDVMDRYPSQYHERMPICVGVGLNREVKWVNLADFPHWLIGGFTNSGKSNMVNVGICTLISRQSPSDLRLILIDLKGGLEFAFYEGIPHLNGQIVDEVSKVADMLSTLEALMAERFKQFRQARCKRIEEYHARRPHESMPRLLCVFDEVASIVDHGDSSRRIAASLRQIAAKGRAVGIHLWLCTQRPEVKIVEGAIKANLAVRLSGRMASSADSVTILGCGAAKDLAPVAGRMMLQLGPDPEPVQTPHITENALADALKRAMAWPQAAPLDMPVSAHVHQEWTPERVAELAVKHLGGKITASAVWNATEDDLSREQARRLVERVWEMGQVVVDGEVYQVKREKGHMRRLIPVETHQSAESPNHHE